MDSAKASHALPMVEVLVLIYTTMYQKEEFFDTSPLKDTLQSTKRGSQILKDACLSKFDPEGRPEDFFESISMAFTQILLHAIRGTENDT